MRNLHPVACIALLLAGCGGSSVRSSAAIRYCFEDRVPRSTYEKRIASTEEGVVSLIYYRSGGDQTTISIFPSEAEATSAKKAEARFGDAHDRRLRNVLYSGGGPIERAVRACAT